MTTSVRCRTAILRIRDPPNTQKAQPADPITGGLCFWLLYPKMHCHCFVYCNAFALQVNSQFPQRYLKIMALPMSPSAEPLCDGTKTLCQSSIASVPQEFHKAPVSQQLQLLPDFGADVVVIGMMVL